MKPWYEDENFWLRIAPVLFNSGRWSAAPEAREKAMRLLKLKRGSSVLDACCGVGRHSVELARMGYRVTGVDQVAEFLEAARDTADAEGFEIEFIHADMRSFFHPFEFDAAICMFTSIGYFENLEEDRQVLSNIRMALKPEGRRGSSGSTSGTRTAISALWPPSTGSSGTGRGWKTGGSW
jgi:cyclopropane fatty-acyl-phospholipid synthase-like methyltransferase